VTAKGSLIYSEGHPKLYSNAPHSSELRSACVMLRMRMLNKKVCKPFQWRNIDNPFEADSRVRRYIFRTSSKVMWCFSMSRAVSCSGPPSKEPHVSQFKLVRNVQPKPSTHILRRGRGRKCKNEGTLPGRLNATPEYFFYLLPYFRNSFLIRMVRWVVWLRILELPTYPSKGSRVQSRKHDDPRVNGTVHVDRYCMIFRCTE